MRKVSAAVISAVVLVVFWPFLAAGFIYNAAAGAFLCGIDAGDRLGDWIDG